MLRQALRGTPVRTGFRLPRKTVYREIPSKQQTPCPHSPRGGARHARPGPRAVHSAALRDPAGRGRTCRSLGGGSAPPPAAEHGVRRLGVRPPNARGCAEGALRRGQVRSSRRRDGARASSRRFHPPAVPCRAVPCQAVPVPGRAGPCLPGPCRARPCLSRAVPGRACPGPCLPGPCLSRAVPVPGRAGPGRACPGPCLPGPCRAGPAGRSRLRRGPFGSAPTPPSGAAEQHGPSHGRILRGARLRRAAARWAAHAPVAFLSVEEDIAG
ncbi:basic proline-rich protein-like [Poecile atricapillus]|uniref:basic proline-rich protein-like n=1 Tax=Poecile atricapillus TaxID=48891 RepID=UPI0027384BFF|nr:basic proline-rich protein-like [Poecile atricapillus]